VKVTFKADADTMDALVRLAEASAAGRGRSRRSAAIRKALIEAAGRLPGVVRNGPTK
jgi:hypothetical protein